MIIGPVGPIGFIVIIGPMGPMGTIGAMGWMVVNERIIGFQTPAVQATVSPRTCWL